MGQRRKLSAEYKREAVAMLESPGVAVHQIAAELGIGATVLGRWRRELRQEPAQAFRGNGRPRDEDWPFCAVPESHQVVCSMSAVGSCADNAAAERFFEVLKRERVNRQHYPDESRSQSGYLRLYRALSQPTPTAEIGDAAARGTTLNSTVRGFDVSGRLVHRLAFFEFLAIRPQTSYPHKKPHSAYCPSGDRWG